MYTRIRQLQSHRNTGIRLTVTGNTSGAQSGDSEYKSASSSLAEPTQRPAAERSSDTSSAMAPPPPLLFDRSPHEEEDDEEEMVFEVWVVSAAPHCSVATVIEYCGQFISIEVRVHHTS